MANAIRNTDNYAHYKERQKSYRKPKKTEAKVEPLEVTSSTLSEVNADLIIAMIERLELKVDRIMEMFEIENELTLELLEETDKGLFKKFRKA